MFCSLLGKRYQSDMLCITFHSKLESLCRRPCMPGQLDLSEVYRLGINTFHSLKYRDIFHHIFQLNCSRLCQIHKPSIQRQWRPIQYDRLGSYCWHQDKAYRLGNYIDLIFDQNRNLRDIQHIFCQLYPKLLVWDNLHSSQFHYRKTILGTHIFQMLYSMFYWLSMLCKPDLLNPILRYKAHRNCLHLNKVYLLGKHIEKNSAQRQILEGILHTSLSQYPKKQDLGNQHNYLLHLQIFQSHIHIFLKLSQKFFCCHKSSKSQLRSPRVCCNFNKQVYCLGKACLLDNYISLQFYQTRILEGKSYIQTALLPKIAESGMKCTDHFCQNMVYRLGKYIWKNYYPKLFHLCINQCKGQEKSNEAVNCLLFVYFMLSVCQLEEEKLLLAELYLQNLVLKWKVQECRRSVRLYEEQLWSANEEWSVEHEWLELMRAKQLLEW